MSPQIEHIDEARTYHLSEIETTQAERERTSICANLKPYALSTSANLSGTDFGGIKFNPRRGIRVDVFLNNLSEPDFGLCGIYRIETAPIAFPNSNFFGIPGSTVGVSVCVAPKVPTPDPSPSAVSGMEMFSGDNTNDVLRKKCLSIAAQW
ncbi:hypothetical protein K440DRAFT_78968 [Wilcoxina mikolae CBS 423.85]|nr:hypothetical protein K440DRAFT_78968 [Wilcoxina mikolae CBS 423.85]